MTGLDRLKRRRASVVAAALAAGAFWLFGSAALTGAPVALTLLGLALALAAGLAIDDRRRARLAAEPGPGIVAVREGRIGYAGPERGGVVELDALSLVTAERRGGGVFWRLRQGDGAEIAIPSGAEGAGALLDAFAALPGCDLDAPSRLLDRPEGATAVLFTRSRPPLLEP